MIIKEIGKSLAEIFSPFVRLKKYLGARVVVFALLSAISADHVVAEGDVFLPQKESPSLLLSMLEATSLGDTYDPASGSLGFSVVDISLPGNFALPVEFRRTFNKGDRRSIPYSGLGGWAIDVPYIRAHYIDATGIWHVSAGQDGWSGNKECEGDVTTLSTKHPSDARGSWKSAPPDTWWDGKYLHIPGQVSENLIVGSGDFSGQQVTSTNHKIASCFTRSDGGQGIVVVGPAGDRYRFDTVLLEVTSRSTSAAMGSARKTRFLVPSIVTDKFGNTVVYSWSDGKLDSIVASDGRRIDFTYLNGLLDTATANGRVWKYSYQNFASGSIVSQKLWKVARPDDRAWRYSSSFYEQEVAHAKVYSGGLDYAWRCEKHTPASGSHQKSFTVDTPEGASITYTIDSIYHASYNVNPYAEDDLGMLTFRNIHCDVRKNLVKRRVSFGTDAYEWNYSYSENEGRYLASDSYGAYANNTFIYGPNVTFIHSRPATVTSAAVVKTTTEVGPSGKIVYYVDRDAQSLSEGKVLAEDYFDLSAPSRLLKRVEYSYANGSNWGSYCSVLSRYYGVNDCDKKNNLKTLDSRVNNTKIKTILFDENGATTSYSLENSGFDFYGFASLTKEYNSYSSKQRFTKQTIANDFTNWVIGQPVSSAISGSSAGPFVEDSRIDYQNISASGLYSNIAVPNKFYRYGAHYKTQKTYHTDGSLKRVELPLANRWLEYTNYKAGQPQTITAPKASGSGTQVFSRVIDENGWLKSVTDFRGHETNYNYDDIGRLTQIRPANTYWNATNIGYSWVSSGEIIPGTYAGMLKQSVTKGYYEKNTYYDNLMRPRLTTERDVRDSNSKMTESARYDAHNNRVFSSYPGRELNSLGVHLQYDALGRLVLSTKDTDAGQVSSSNHYLTGNAIRTVDYKGNVTVTRYLSYGQPNYEQALAIESPESVTTTLDYSLYGKLTSITQGGITQYNIYDAHQRLCKEVRPDIGNTSYVYNDNNEIAWTAHSSSVSSSTTVCDTTVDAVDKIIHAYDNLGRLESLTYGDGTASKNYVYDLDGNVTQLTMGDFVLDYQYDDQSNLVKETLSGDYLNSVLDYKYDAEGNLSSLTYPTGHIVSLAANSRGQATSVVNTTSGTSYASGIKYHPSGAISDFTFGNGMVYKMLQNDELLPESIAVTNGGAMQVGFQYGYDSNGNIDSILDQQNSTYNVSLTYDGLDRLDTATGKWGGGSFDYDAMGNIAGYTLGSFSLSYVYDSDKRLSSVSGGKTYSFAYDERGNVTGNTTGGALFEYNLANQMVEVGNNSYSYDGQNKRVKKQSIEGIQYFHYSRAGKLIYSYKPTGEHIDYIYLGNNLIAKDSVQPTPDSPVVVMPPSTPSSISIPASPNVSGSYSIGWAVSTGASSYTLQEKKDSGSWTSVTSQAGTSKALSGKTSGSYTYRVRACNSAGCSGWKTSASFAVSLPVIPGVPASITVPTSTNTSGSYTISWAASAGATSYKLEEKKDSGSWTNVANQTGTSKGLSGRSDGSYSYRIQACNSSGCSGWKTSASFSVSLPPAVPGVPASITVPTATNTNGSYTVSWAASTGATSYKLEEKKDSGNWSYVVSQAGTSIGLSGKTDGSYSYRVQACNSSGCSGWKTSGSFSVSLPPPVPAVPASINVPTSTNTSGSYTVSWAASTGATSYKLEEKKGSGNWGNVASQAGTSKALSGKTNGSYSYRVQACNSSGCSDWRNSGSFSVSLPPAAPVSITAPTTTNTSGSYTISWTASTTATSYKLEEKKDGGSWTNVVSQTGTSKALSGKTNGNYSYRVQACNSSGCSGWRTSSSFSVNIPPPSIPTVTLGCNPCSASAYAYTYKNLVVNVSATIGCDNTCTVEWFNSGSTKFKITGSGTSYSFNEFCRPPPTGTYFNHTGSVWLKVTDTTSGQYVVSPVKNLSLVCY